MKIQKTTISSLFDGARKDVGQEGDQLHVIIGDDETTEKERQRLLRKGVALTDQDGVRRFQRTTEIFPTHWHQDGNRTLHDVTLHFFHPALGHTTEVVKQVWRKSS